MKLPNSRSDRATANHLLSPNEASSTGIGLYILDLLSKGVSWECPNNTGHCKDSRLFSRNWQKGPVAEHNTFTTHWTWRNWSGAYIEPLLLHASVFGTGSYSAHYQNRSVHWASHKPRDLQWCPTWKYARAMVAQILWDNLYLIWLEAYSRR